MNNVYTNIQTNEVLDANKVEALKDNAMLKIKPELWEIWDFEKNDELGLDIWKVTKSPKGKSWWYCSICKDSYPQAIGHKVNGTGCSICTGKYVSISNCLYTTNPDIIQYLLNPEDGYKYSRCSEKRIDWKCPNCDNIVKSRRVVDITRRGLSCSVCSDGVKFPEKIMSGVLSQLNIEYNFDMSMHFSDIKRYDFYIPEYNLIIETHGGQHYEEGFKSVGGDSLETVQLNDKYKYEIAMKNGIDTYIVIDCRYSEIEWIKNNILSSELATILDLSKLDWNLILLNSTKSNKLECLEMYLNGRRDYKEMADDLKVDYATIIRWLNQWSKLGKCEYIPLDTSKSIVQLDMDGNFIKQWSSISQARVHYKNISKVLSKERSNDQGSRFMYEDEYEKFLKDKNSYIFRENKITTKKVVQLSLDDSFIDEWNSLTEAAHSLGKKHGSGIGAVCRGLKKKHAGFKWMYKEDYESLVKSK